MDRRKTERDPAANKMLSFYPDTGPLRRELYSKHMAFFAAGREYQERAMVAANRIGKTLGVGAYETAMHLTGRYPDWWVGHRFKGPIQVWAAGDTSETTRDIVQAALMGQLGNLGSGMIPAVNIIGEPSKRMGVAGAMDTARILHQDGHTNLIGFKSYDQGRKKFQGTAKDLIWLDEECPADVYDECLMRLMTTDGLMLCTFTPLEGLTEVVLRYLPHLAPAVELGEGEEGKPQGIDGTTARFSIQAEWDDVPHLSADQKAWLWNSIPPYQRDARSKGVPALGSGAIYPVPESDIVCDAIEIPKHWPRVYAMDVGWKRTAVLWGAWDRDNDTIYLYAEYYRGQAEPAVHAAAVKARNDWIPGVIDPAARGRSQIDGTRLIEQYDALGLDLNPAKNAVEAGIYAVWERLSTGRIKVVRSLHSFLAEYRIYRRDEKGAIVKDSDHLMDCVRYLVMSGLDRAIVQPVKERHRSSVKITSAWAV